MLFVSFVDEAGTRSLSCARMFDIVVKAEDRDS